MKVIIISGRSGSGKSSTTYEAAHILKQNGVMHAAIEADNLDMIYPKGTDDKILFQNLTSVLSTYWHHACPLLTQQSKRSPQFVILLNGTGMVLLLEKLEAMLTNVVSAEKFATANKVDVEVFPVVLRAEETIVTQRLTAREIGGELEAHLLSTRRMGALLDEWSQNQDRRVGFISSQGRAVHDVAAEVLELAGIELVC